MQDYIEPTEPKDPIDFVGIVEMLTFHSSTPPANDRPIMISDGRRLDIGWYSHTAKAWFTRDNCPVNCIAWAEVPGVDDFCHEVLEERRLGIA